MKLLASFGKGGAIYFVQASHRTNAVGTAILLVEEAYKREMEQFDDLLFDDSLEATSSWIIETIIQAAYIREYHYWEKDTKAYFVDQLLWNQTGRAFPNNNQSHVAKVKGLLAEFSVSISPEIFDGLDQMRIAVNAAKHDPTWKAERFVSRDEHIQANAMIERFWTELMELETYLPRIPGAA